MDFGIDLGTENSLVGVWEQSNVDIVNPDDSGRRIPSYVAFRNGAVLLGSDAKLQVTRNAPNTLFAVKRLLGADCRAPAFQVTTRYWPFKVVVHGRETPSLEVTHNDALKVLSVSEALHYTLLVVKQYMSYQAHNGRLATVVLAVPGHFTISDRHEVAAAAHQAGLGVTLVNEASALAVAYLFKARPDSPRNLLIYNFGAGCCNVAVAHVGPDGATMLADVSCSDLGGDDFDARLMDRFIQEFQQRHGVDLRSSSKAVQRLRLECARARAVLSTVNTANVEVDGIVGAQDLATRITRDQFEADCSDLFARSDAMVHAALTAARVSPNHISDVLLVGGASRMSRVQSSLLDKFKVRDLCRVLNADEGVAYGAALCAARLAHGDEVPIATWRDVSTHTLGIMVSGGSMQPLVARFAALPARAAVMLTTAADRQTSLSVLLYQGEQPHAQDNALVARYDLTGLRRMARGQAAVQLSVVLEAPGDLVVEVQDLSQQRTKPARMRIDASKPPKAPPSPVVAVAAQLPVYVQHTEGVRPAPLVASH